jgi:hypothetical protein
LITFICGSSTSITTWDVRFSNGSSWTSTYTVIFSYHGTIALNCSSCQLTGVAPSASNIVPKNGTITYTLGSTTSSTVVTYELTPSTCGIFLITTYMITIVGGIGTKNWLTGIYTDGKVLTIDIYSIAAADAGSYVLTMTTTTEQLDFNYTDDYVLNVVVVDPCYTPTWNTNSIADIYATVLQSPASITTFTASTTTGSCGSITYTMSPTTYSIITMNASTRQITVSPTAITDISTYAIQIVASLVSYPSATGQTLSFNVIVNACVVTGVTVVSNGFNPALTSSCNIEDPIGFLRPIATFT